jgi:hypothetical protein
MNPFASSKPFLLLPAPGCKGHFSPLLRLPPARGGWDGLPTGSRQAGLAIARRAAVRADASRRRPAGRTRSGMQSHSKTAQHRPAERGGSAERARGVGRETCGLNERCRCSHAGLRRALPDPDAVRSRVRRGGPLRAGRQLLPPPAKTDKTAGGYTGCFCSLLAFPA